MPKHNKEPAPFRQSVGLSSLSRQIYRKATKHGYFFTLMVCGESQLGKTTLLNSLFLANDEDNNASTYEPETTTKVIPRKLEITEHAVNLKLTVIDTPGFNDSLNNKECWKPLVEYIDGAFAAYLQGESQVDRTGLEDGRVHCLLYFLDPNSHGLKSLDIEAMKQLHQKVNIVPVIAKADSLTTTELKALKKRILEELEENEIQVFTPGLEDETDEEAYKESLDLVASQPLSVIGANTFFASGGKTVRGRQYPWGFVDVDNEAHSDFAKLRRMLVRSHLEDLKGLTQEVHYELYRKQTLKNATVPISMPVSSVTGTHADKINEESELTPQEKTYEQMKMEVEEQARLLEQMRQKLEMDKQKSTVVNL
eukprot:m.30653 g.30653  ORF g.30653 m.30653 type:complete len:367 (-) comp8223_c0_seq1:139-1239(-)